MGFPHGTAAPLCPRPLLVPNTTRFYPCTPYVRRNVSKKFLAMGAPNRQDGNVEGPVVARRALLMVSLVGSSLLRLGEAVAGDLNADVYHPISLLRDRARKKNLKESSSRRGRKARPQPLPGGDDATVEARKKEGSGRNDAQSYSADTTGPDAARMEINQEMPLLTQDTEVTGRKSSLSTQDTKDFSQEMQSSTQTVSATIKDTPSLAKNETEVNPEMPSSLQIDTKQDKQPVDPPLSILNTVGIISSVVLGALYAITQKDKEVIQSDLDSMASLLEEKETAKILLEKNFEKKMLTDQEEHRKQINKLREVEIAISNQLAGAKATISALGKELQSEKNALKEINVQIDQLHDCLGQASEEKSELEGQLKEQTIEINALQDRVSLLGFNIKDKEKDIEDLTNSLTDQRSECEKLNSVLKQTKADYESSCSRVEKLEEDVALAKNELAFKDSEIDELNNKLKSLLVERDGINQNITALRGEYNNFKIDSANKVKMDSEILSGKDKQFQQLEQKLNLTIKEVEDIQASVVTVTKEKDRFEGVMKEEMKSAKNLQNELQITRANMESSKQDCAEISKLLKESIDKCKDLNTKLSKVQMETSEVQKSLIHSVNESQATCDELSTELVTAKKDLDMAMQELVKAIDELQGASKAYTNLKSELLEVFQKYELTTSELLKEREVVAKLNEELEGSRQQLGELLESRKTLESDLTRASTSLEETANRASLLSQELISAQSTNVELEREKEMLQDLLAEQRNAAQEALQEIEDAQKIILRLGAERDSLVNKTESLGEELASAKGEILLLRKQTNPRNASLDENQNSTNGVEASTKP